MTTEAGQALDTDDHIEQVPLRDLGV